MSSLMVGSRQVRPMYVLSLVRVRRRCSISGTWRCGDVHKATSRCGMGLLFGITKVRSGLTRMTPRLPCS